MENNQLASLVFAERSELHSQHSSSLLLGSQAEATASRALPASSRCSDASCRSARWSRFWFERALADQFQIIVSFFEFRLKMAKRSFASKVSNFKFWREAALRSLSTRKLTRYFFTDILFSLTHYWDEALSANDDLKPLLGIYSDFIPAKLRSEEAFLLGEKDREGQRIRQILVILRNIVQDRLDTHIIRRNERVFCFLLRCALSSEDTGLIEQSLETLSMLLESDKTDKSPQLPGKESLFSHINPFF